MKDGGTKAFTCKAAGHSVLPWGASPSSVRASGRRTPQAGRKAPPPPPSPPRPQAPPPAAASTPATARHLQKRGGGGSARPPLGGGGGSGGGARAHRWEQLRRAARRAGGCFLRCGRGRQPGGCGGRARLPRRRREAKS
uniref:vasodilator-stimulated phosphoprotein-like n=1 Tax=Panthera onca TaxID=9690 RepID=UPI00295498DF|nr:vasodilator-stimulated phosphoprotein-like [Panthera onca]